MALCSEGGNPLIPDVGMADPHFRVFDGRLYLYTGHDTRRDARDWCMPDWRIFASDDLVHGRHEATLTPAETPWTTTDRLLGGRRRPTQRQDVLRLLRPHAVRRRPRGRPPGRAVPQPANHAGTQSPAATGTVELRLDVPGGPLLADVPLSTGRANRPPTPPRTISSWPSAHRPAIRRRIEAKATAFSHPVMGAYRLLACSFESEPGNGTKDLPLTLVDDQAGAVAFRSGWGNTTAVITADAKQSAATTRVTAMDFSIRAFGRNWVRWRPPDYGVFWLPRPHRNKPNAPRLPGLLPAEGAEVTHVETAGDGSGRISMVLDYYVPGEPWVFKTSPCFRHEIEADADTGVTAERTVAVDYSGRSGAPVLVAVADRIRGAGERLPIWTMNVPKGVVPIGDFTGRARTWKLPSREIDDRIAEVLRPQQKSGGKGDRPNIQPLPETRAIRGQLSGDTILDSVLARGWDGGRVRSWQGWRALWYRECRIT